MSNKAFVIALSVVLPASVIVGAVFADADWTTVGFIGALVGLVIVIVANRLW